MGIGWVLAPLFACSGLQGIEPLPGAPPVRTGLGGDGRTRTYALPREAAGLRVELWARRSYMARRIAVHPWFVVVDPARDESARYEVWGLQPVEDRSEAGTYEYVDESGDRVEGRWTSSRFGTIDVDTQIGYAIPFRRGVRLGAWDGDEATRIADVLRRPDDYPYRNQYRAWPGPNSNTYAAWSLRTAGVPFDPHPLAVGKDYRGPFGFGLGVTPAFTGAQVETPLVGIAVGAREGVELHLLALTLGLDLWPPAFKTPFGRYGVPE